MIKNNQTFSFSRKLHALYFQEINLDCFSWGFKNSVLALLENSF